MTEKPLSDSLPVLKNILSEMGVDNYEPRVLKGLNTFMQNHAVKLIKDAQSFSTRAGKSVIDADDVRLAIKCFEEEMHKPLKRETVITMAENINKQPLPANKNMNGIRLPQPKKTKSNLSAQP